MSRRFLRAFPLAVGLLLCPVGSARAQTLLVNDDRYGVPFGQSLLVEAFGVLDNDTLDGEPAGENGATAELVTGVSHGTLALNSDGSFTYTPDSSFSGSDAFTYRAVFDAVPSETTATVALTACTGGPQLYSCWQESAYLALAVEFGYRVFREGFEDDATWGSVREPATPPSVMSRGVQWTTNHPATNEITTGSGPARSGAWGIYDPDHGVATGTPAECDIDIPPPACLYHDGLTGTRDAGRSALHGVGGFITGTTGANVAAILDGVDQVGFGHLPDPGHQFFGVIDADVSGFTTFEFRELDGKVGQLRLVFADDFTFATLAPEAVPSLSGPGAIGLAVLFALAAAWWGRRPERRQRLR